jgi:predicted ribosomally synthesized peptide with nif11-like leader
MSKEIAIQFLQTVDKSPELRRQVQSVEGQVETPEGLKKFLQVADKAGYQITADDLKIAVRSHNEHLMEMGELSEEDLEKVAGGAINICLCSGCCCTRCCWTSAYVHGA